MDPKLLKLQQKWYKKLEKSGFKDIESPFKPGQPLKHWDSIHFQLYQTKESFLERQRYYQLAEQMLHDFKFKKKVHKKIWEMHAKGRSLTEISESVKLHRNTVYRIIRKYASYIKYNSD